MKISSLKIKIIILFLTLTSFSWAMEFPNENGPASLNHYADIIEDVSKKIVEANPHLAHSLGDIIPRYKIHKQTRGGVWVSNVHICDLAVLQLKVLPPEFGRYNNLNVLNLSSNKLEELTIEVSKIPCLLHLNLMGNKIKKIPPQIVNMNSKAILDLSANPLQLITGILPEWMKDSTKVPTILFMETIYESFYKRELSHWGVWDPNKKQQNVFVDNCLKSVAPVQKKFMNTYILFDSIPNEIFLDEIKKLIYGYLYELLVKDMSFFNREAIVIAKPFYSPPFTKEVHEETENNKICPT